MIWLTLPVAAAGALYWWLRARLRVVEVRGGSMRPTYLDGDRLLVRRRRRPAAGQVAVFRRPELPGRSAADVDWLVKRVVATAGEPVPAELAAVVADRLVPAGRFLVRGDNPDSIDSRHFGYIAERDLLGTAVRVLPAGRPRAEAGPTSR